MRTELELRHLHVGAVPDERPDGLLMSFVALAPGRVNAVVSIAKAVMISVISNADSSPSIERWRQLLPSSFVAFHAPEQTKEEAARWLAEWMKLAAPERGRASEARRWTLSDWLYWLEPQHREWYWWDSESIDENRVRIVVEVPGSPAGVGALRWLLRGAGAASVTEERS